MKVLIVSHESDLDGLFSAAIGLVRYPQARSLFLGYRKESLENLPHFIRTFTVSSSSDHEMGLIIICDLALNDNKSILQLYRRSLLEASNAGFDLVWLDHHPWSDEAKGAIHPFVELVLDEAGNKCAAELVYERFLYGNELANKLASIARSMDFFTQDQYLTPISELIIYYLNSSDRHEKLCCLASKISRGILWDIGMQNDYGLYSRILERAKVEAYKTIQFRQIDGRFKAAFVQSLPYIHNSLFAHEVFKNTDSDLVVLYGPDKKVSIRRNNNQISCRKIAQNLSEGGGHEFAAGASFKSDPLDHKGIIMELEEAILRSVVNETGS